MLPYMRRALLRERARYFVLRAILMSASARRAMRVYARVVYCLMSPLRRC